MAGRKTIIGIYCIKNTVNNKVYVGGSSFGVLRRLSNHRSQLRGGKHFNAHLQASFNKHGARAFEFLILEECAAEKIGERETYHINRYKSCEYAKGFNRQKNPSHGPRNNREARRASSERMKKFHAAKSPAQRNETRDRLMAARGTISSAIRCGRPYFTLVAGPKF